MTNGIDPAAWFDSNRTVCLLVPEELQGLKGVDAITQSTLEQIYGPSGWTLMPTSDPRFAEGVDRSMKNDPTISVVSREQGVVTVTREGLPKPLVRHIRFALLDEDHPSIIDVTKSAAVPAAQSVDAPSPARFAQGFEENGKVTHATAKATPVTKKRKAKR